MDTQQLSQWLATYKLAWEQQDPYVFVRLFTPDCEYRDHPFIEPVKGYEFQAFWRALAETQQENQIDFEILGFTPDQRAIVNWQATTTRRGTNERREGNGIFVLTFEAEGRCSDLREWQHWHPIGAPLEKRSINWRTT